MTDVEHLVLVQWAGSTDDATVQRVRELARGLTGAIPGVLRVTEGPSVSPEGLESGFDWALCIRFDSVASRDAYLPHPAHRPVAELIGANAERVVVFDVSAS